MMSVSAQALGQSEDELSQARGWFQEALALEVAGDYPSALGKLQQVAKVRLTPQVRYHLARCKENLGRLTEALGDYRLATTEARELALAELEEFERALAALEERVPKLKIVLSPRAPSSGSVVELDGVRLGATALLEPIVVDPGLRRVRLSDAVGELQVVEAEAKEGTMVEVVLRAERKQPERAPIAARVERQPTPTWPYISGGIGATFVATSVALFAVRASALRELESSCNRQHECDPSLRSTYSRGKFASWAAPTALGIGGVALGVSVWRIWPGHRDKRAARDNLEQHRFVVGFDRNGIGVRFNSDF